MIVSKFGGTSLADAQQMRKVRDIVRSNPDRTCVVVSAPGKRNARDRKITDILIQLHRQQADRATADSLKTEVITRFTKIVHELGIDFNVGQELAAIMLNLHKGASEQYMASRGEYLSALIMAKLLGFEFVDAADIIQMDAKGNYLLSNGGIIERVHNKRVVVPGFYGACGGEVKTFSRGGSDITGAIIAGAMEASCYENWTDVSGILMADPRIVDNPREIEKITYHELRELTYSGANVFHRDAVRPVEARGIPIWIRNTLNPDAPGTRIVAHAQSKPGQITGIAGRSDFTVFTIRKVGMHEEIGFFAHVLEQFRSMGINIEHVPGGIDTLSVIVPSSQIDEQVIDQLNRGINPYSAQLITITTMPVALIAVVGRGMAGNPGSAAKIFRALADVGIDVKLINQGALGTNIIVGVEVQHFERATQVLYSALVN